MGKNVWAYGAVTLLLLWFFVISFGINLPFLNRLNTEKPPLTLQNFGEYATGKGVVIGEKDPTWLHLWNLEEGENPHWKMIFATPAELKLSSKAPINLKNPIKFTDKKLDDFVARRNLLGIVQTYRDNEEVPVMLITSMNGGSLPLLNNLQTMTVPVAFNLDGTWFAIPIDQSVRLIEPIFTLSDWWKDNRIWIVSLLAFFSVCFITYTKKNLTQKRFSI